MKGRYKNLYAAALLAFYFIQAQIGFCEKFEFKQNVGDKFRIVSVTDEEVLRNGKAQHKSKILNRMASEVVSLQNGRASIHANFNVAEEASEELGEGADEGAGAGAGAGTAASTINEGQIRRFQWGEEYNSIFARDKLGKITIDKKYFMPSARDVPLFPDRELKAGESWVSQGTEVFDLRHIFGIAEPYTVPFRANNTFLGEREWKNKKYKTIQISCSFFKNEGGFEDSPTTYMNRGTRQSALKKGAVQERPVLKRISGKSKQTLYWDEELGQIAAAEDEFELNFELQDQTTWTFRGKTVSEVIEASRMDKKELAREVEDDIKKLGLEDVSIKESPEGISISLDDIQFAADSAVLMSSERDKLDKIAEILLKYQSRDILVSGHTASAGGSEQSRLKLSEQRAGAVAAYLIQKKVRSPERVMTKGFGSARPAASNANEAGRRKNRRVEITILEN